MYWWSNERLEDQDRTVGAFPAVNGVVMREQGPWNPHWTPGARQWSGKEVRGGRMFPHKYNFLILFNT